MPDPAPKAQRWIIIPWGLFILAIIGWSVWWLIGAHQIGARMDREADVLRKAGWRVSWQMRSVSGYPFRFFIQLSDAKIQEPSGWGLSAPRLEAEASALTPGVVVIAATRNGVVVLRPGLPALAVNGDVLHMSLSGLGASPPRISIEGVNLKPASGAFSTIGRFQAYLRPGANGDADVNFRIDTATPAADGLLARVAAGRPVTVDVEGQLSQTASLKGASSDEALAHWAAAGGQLQITQGGIAVGPDPLLSLNPSSLSIDEQGFAKGALSASLTRPADAVLALGAISVLPPQTAAVAAGLAPTGAELELHDGKVWMGPAAIGEAPRLLSAPGTAGG